jgi:hypothetical protein
MPLSRSLPNSSAYVVTRRTFVMGYFSSGAIASTSAASDSALASGLMSRMLNVLWRSLPSLKYPTRVCTASLHFVNISFAILGYPLEKNSSYLYGWEEVRCFNNHSKNFKLC